MSKRARTQLSFSLLSLCLLAMAAPPIRAQFGTGGDVLQPMRTLQGEDQSGRAPNRTADRRQQAQGLMQESARQVDETLVEVLEMVNRGEKLAPDKIEACRAAYEAAKKYAPQFDNALKCEAFMLRAWTEYFAKDLEQAYIAAKTACETDRMNQDAGATQVAMSVLMGRVPLKIEPRRPRTTPGRGGTDSFAARQNERAAQIGVQASSGDILQFDVDAVDLSLIGQPMAAMKLNCMNGTSLDYRPESNLSALLWQLGAKEVDATGEPNTPNAQAGRVPPRRPGPQMLPDVENRGRVDPRRGGAYDEPGRRGDDSGRRGSYDPSYGRVSAPSYDTYGYTAPDHAGPQSDPLVAETAAYGRLFGAYIGNPRVTFVAVNTDAITNTPAVVNKLLASPWPWANVMAAAPGGGAPQFAALNPTRPVLLIASGGKIQYAGPADGFLAPMVLEHLAGQPMTAGETLAPAPAVPANGLLNPLKTLLGGNGGSRTVTLPPAPVLMPPQPSGQAGDEEEELTPEAYQAQKDLEYARGLFIPAGRKNFLTSKRGVDLCRKIIREHPNTKYAQEARLLLRQVPENERQRYNITNEEMGL